MKGRTVEGVGLRRPGCDLRGSVITFWVEKRTGAGMGTLQ